METTHQWTSKVQEGKIDVPVERSPNVSEATSNARTVPSAHTVLTHGEWESASTNQGDHRLHALGSGLPFPSVLTSTPAFYQEFGVYCYIRVHT